MICLTDLLATAASLTGQKLPAGAGIDGLYQLRVLMGDATIQGDGHGFTSLRHRARTLGGKLALESKPGAGTRVTLHGCLHPARLPHVSPT